MNRSRRTALALSVGLLLASPALAQENPFLGRWALTPAAGGAGWLEVRRENGRLEGTLLWMGGSPEPQTRVWIEGDRLVALRVWNEQLHNAAGQTIGNLPHPVLLSATVSGKELRGHLVQPSNDGNTVSKDDFTGKPVPPLPARPDLSKIRFGKPIVLFNGKDLDGWAVIGGAHWTTLGLKRPDGADAEGWVPVDKSVANGWGVQEGVLVNAPVQKPGQHLRYGNLETREDFEDFNLTLEVNVPPHGNSGVYLRGIYEVQVADTFGKRLDRHNMGAIYGRITPTAAAEKPAGQWQTLDITLVNRHATVKLNGKTVVNNQPIVGCTGGALWSDESRPGPIYLQGDHTAIKYRNIVLRPVLK